MAELLAPGNAVAARHNASRDGASHASSSDNVASHHERPKHDEAAVRQSFQESISGRDVAQIDPRVEQARTLTTLDVAALIINKMVGTGIFTGPGLVVLHTRNKNVALGLWFLGFVYTLLSMLLYLEYARKLPFTGGELVYMDDVLPKPRLLAYTLYAFYFVMLYTTTTNSLQFSRFVLIASDIKFADIENLQTQQRLWRFLAIVIMTAACFLLYASTARSKFANRATAAFKIVFLTGVVFAGAAYVAKMKRLGQIVEREADWSRTVSGNGSWPVKSWAQAFIVCLFSYHGWENATLVSGEIHSFTVLRRGFISAVFIVGSLYISITVVLYASFNWPEDSSGPAPPIVSLDFLPFYLSKPLQNASGQYIETSQGAKVAAAVLIAISAFGSLVSVTYTSVRVKQSIGWANILPWSSLWRRRGPVYPSYDWQARSNGITELGFAFTQRALNRPGTPEGGVMLHWLVSVFYIVVSAVYGNVADALAFSGNLLVFAHFFAEGAIGFLFIPLGKFGFKPQLVSYIPALKWHRLQITDPNAEAKDIVRPPAWLRPKGLESLGPAALLGGFVFAFSLAVVIASCWTVAGRVLLYVVLGIFGTAFIYWFAFVNMQSASKVYGACGFSLEAKVHGIHDVDSPDRACDWCVSGVARAHRHPLESYLEYNSVRLQSQRLGPRLLGALFGGTREGVDIRLWSDLKDEVHMIWDNVRSRRT